jgi:phosphinothricin acetyltransferase
VTAPGGGAAGAARIRLAAPADAGSLAALYAPAVRGRATSFELEPPDAAEMGQRVATVLARTPWLVCERAGRVVGYAYAGRHRDRAAYQWSVEVSAYVDTAAHRGGVGRALYESLFAVLALQGFRNAYAGITLPNPASQALHAAAGFTPVGVYRGVGYKAGAWHDVLWLERPLAERVPEPPAPTALPALLGTPVLEAALAAGISRLRTP